MGFWAKVVTFCPTTQKVNPRNKKSPDCKIWQRTGIVLDFDRVTRVEKLLHADFYHLNDSYQKAGIYMVDVIFRRLPPLLSWETPLLSQYAPPLLIRKMHGWEERSADEADRKIRPTVIAAGGEYVECLDDDVKGHMADSPRQRKLKHNRAVAGQKALVTVVSEPTHSIIDPPFRWCSCSVLREAFDADRDDGSEPRAVISADPLALAIVQGWHDQVRHLARVEAFALLAFG